MSENICRWGILGTAGIAKKNWQSIKNAGNVCCGNAGDGVQAFVCRTRHVRREGNVGCVEDRACGIGRLTFQHVERSTPQPADGECEGERLLVYQWAARGVDQERTLFHLGDRPAADEMGELDLYFDRTLWISDQIRLCQARRIDQQQTRVSPGVFNPCIRKRFRTNLQIGSNVRHSRLANRAA